MLTYFFDASPTLEVQGLRKSFQTAHAGAENQLMDYRKLGEWSDVKRLQQL